MKLEKLEEFKRDCAQRNHRMTDVEKNLCDAEYKEFTRTAIVTLSCGKVLPSVQDCAKKVIV